MKNYLIIGASSGIGKTLAEQLASENHTVFGTYNTHAIEGHGNASFHFLDVLSDDLDLSFLPDKIDGLVYCPGSINLKPFTRFKPEDFLDDFNLQVVGGVKIIQKVMPLLKAANKPSVVLFSTVAVQNGFNFHSQVATSKGAIEGLTRALAAEFAPKIRVNCIAPSITDTPLASGLLNNEAKKEANAQRHPLKAIGSTQDIAEIAAFLLSDKAHWITGQVLHVDGGMSSIKG
ncbi:SDR family NAD(P)-dependent oxidoreductase [Flexithrix dorotheae]|uniref:SDR family NAD(P)-dependent oxidoreductase n=1 Tax=Flexithrix dorotheae TaxID=70993 RepID=UPI000368F86F|nr:SDR family oxidoreductase [Flexithrix dorotheae]